MAGDITLQRDVMGELAWEPRVDAAEIGVSVEGGIVILNGTVKSFPEKWAAESAAQRVKGVKAVTDELTVKLPGNSERSDADIARAAVSALEWHTLVPHDDIQVLVEKGWVTLDGLVEFHFQRAEAEMALRNLIGVRGVSNQIRVKPPISSIDVKHQIEMALERVAEMDAKNISVETHGNQIVLRGCVRSRAEREQAEQTAWSAPGVATVLNRIAVSN